MPPGGQVWAELAADTGTKRTFFTPFEGSVQRLPNGNTLVDEAIWGRFFQVTPAGEVVWEYNSPFVRKVNPYIVGFPGNAAYIYRGQAAPYSWVPKGRGS